MSKQENLKRYISELIQEVEKELEETTTTGNVDGYQTPHAFSRKSDTARRKKTATQFGYKLVDNDVNNIDEAYNGNLSDFKTDIVLALDNVGISPKAIKKISKKGKGFELHMSSYMKNKVLWEKLGKQMGAKLVDFQPGSVNVGLYESVNEGVWTPEQKRQVELLDSQFREYLSKKGIEPTTIEASRAWKSLGFQDKMRKIFPKSKYESVSESADYKYLTQAILDAKPKHNVYYNSGHNVVNIGGTGYDSGELVKQFNQKPGSSSTIKNNFYHANKDPQKTKREVEKLSNGKIKVNVQKGYGGEPMVVYTVKESVNEAKIKRPVNRWLELKNDETMHPHKKMAHGLKELKYQLAETEKFFRWYNQIKTMNELDSTTYWKRTQNHIYKIKERLINIAKTLQEIEK